MTTHTKCPTCGARDVRVSRFRSLGERLRGMIGTYPVRCKKCDYRFRATIWRPTVLKYARCPKCYRLELSTWSEQYYKAPTWTTLRLRLGATPYRCEFCRCNFASFRPCKERFSWRKHRQSISGAPAA